MGQHATTHHDPEELVTELASLAQALLGLQAQLAAVGPDIGRDPRARRSLARSRALVDELHLRAWDRRVPAGSCAGAAGPGTDGTGGHDQGRGATSAGRWWGRGSEQARGPS